MTNQALKMTNDQLMRAAFNMEQNGGHFARALAKAFYAADSGNRRRILEAFGHMFEDYQPASWENDGETKAERYERLSYETDQD